MKTCLLFLCCFTGSSRIEMSDFVELYSHIHIDTDVKIIYNHKKWEFTETSVN